MKPSSSSSSRKESKRKRKKKALQADQSAPKKKRANQDDDPYSHLDSATAAALRKDDEEIAALEAKMGLTSSKEKKRLHKEYAKLNGYGDDFGDFLDSVDTLVARVNDKQEEEDYESYQQKYGLLLEEEEGEGNVDFQYTLMDSEDEDEDEDDEIVPMKDACMDSEEEEEMLQQNHESRESVSTEDEEDEDDEQNAPENRQQSSDDDSDGSSDGDEQPDHHIQDTYRPSQGEDIYGNPLHQKDQGPAPKKYVPPHLRKKQQDASQHDQADQVRQREVQRLLNNSLNRLSENTLISVAQAIAASLYPSYPTAIVNECIWKNLRIACIERPHLMTGLIPVYVACLSGVHVQMGDKAQVGEYLLEHTVTDLWNEIQNSNNSAEKLNDDTIQKDASNLILVLCYLYNYGIVHCSFLYSVIRSFIESFREIEVELLLLILSHCGRSLRSDDPTALKEIVLTVQKRALQKGTNKDSGALSSRVEYMISAMMDLKNNKKRKADVAHAEKVSKLRKLLGQIKSSSGSRSADSLRIGLDDILNVSTKGRWWKVGASWVGNQYRFEEGGAADTSRSSKEQSSSSSNDDTNNNKEDAKLLKLAAKARMNTDAKRAIFCIIMKSADCEDAFEKLSRAGHMKNRKERDAVRVLMECCGNEKTYNPFYAHLGARMCEYQPQCKFSMQLAYWDVFKQFDDGDSVSARKAANLAKLAFHLVVIQPSLKLGVLKALDMSSPDELSEASVIFLTIFFSKLLEHFDNPSDVRMFLENEVKKKKGNRGGFDADDDDANDMIGGNESMGELNDDNDDGGLGPSISIFLLQTLKASPKYKKGSRFKTNLKAAVKACDTEDFFF
ncbi:Suppressor of glycerol defect protein 1 [Seminavis robusta]|uniref:Suppressor of glycerol defect protein 1 n=1 Tax=Seminavis robusta TaxID=568900 RepID=A0A9N8DMF1_9STRA|nr:Suppressor of glycerol defect protein 1 [Seminavis robusta]|eukprot:Sro214_g088640.1 Suppressor of glycerol defect protein 1 (841) ;mRNA; f:5879-8401